MLMRTVESKGICVCVCVGGGDTWEGGSQFSCQEAGRGWEAGSAARGRGRDTPDAVVIQISITHSAACARPAHPLCNPDAPTWKAVRMYCVRMKGLSCLESICCCTSLNRVLKALISFSLLPAAFRSFTA
jgi:hypothetical protein